MSATGNERLIVALDLPSIKMAEKLVLDLDDSISFYKIGLALTSIGGLKLAENLKLAGKLVFLDLKLFDIGNTIENTINNLKFLNIDFLTVHGDPHIVRSAIKARGGSNMKILAVTILTSLDRQDLTDSLITDGTVSDLVVRRAKNAFSSGADGVIASPNEVEKIRSLREADGKLIVTPGIRLLGTPTDDQKRTSDPLTAFKNGSDFIVVGRPIYSSKAPLLEVKKFQIALDYKKGRTLD